MTDENRFDVEGDRAREAAKPAGQPTPMAPGPQKPPGPGFAVDPKPAARQAADDAPVKARTRLRRPADHGSAGQPMRGPDRPPPRTASPRKDGVFFLFRPGFLLLLGAVLLALFWSGGFFAHTDEAKAVWPWELFAQDGQFNFQWTADHIETLLGAFFVLFFLIASFSPARPGRGAAVLTVVALGLMLKAPGEDDYATYLGYLLLGLAVASLISRVGIREGRGGRAFVFVVLILLAASLFFPTPSSGNGYDAEALRVWRALTGGDTALGDVLHEGANQVVLLQALLLVLSILSVFGARGGWMVWVGGIALYVAVLAPLVVAGLEHETPEGTSVCLALHHALVAAMPAAFLAFVLPMTAGAADAARKPGPA